jgi:hypothetical protein
MITSSDPVVTASMNEGKIVLTLFDSRNYFTDNIVNYYRYNTEVSGTVSSILNENQQLRH